MARKTAAASQLTHEKILDAALTIFGEKGVSASSLEDIALSAGMTRGAVYWHFKNKDDVLAGVLHRHVLPLEVIDRGQTLGEDIQYISKAVLATLRDDASYRLLRVLIQGAQADTTHLMIRRRSLLARTRFKRHLLASLRRAVQRHELPPGYQSCHITARALAIHSGIDGLLHEFLWASASTKRLRKIEEAIPLIFCAAAAPPRLPHP